VQALKAALAVDTGVGERLLVIDQLEEAFDLADATEADLFLDLLTNAVTEDGSRTRAVLALRADYYGRPLLHATFSAAFEGGVVNVAPMTATELESAIVEPARRVAIDVEAGLLAELVADSVGRAGALPLLQDVLSELFELRDAELLRVADYQAIGGLRGALSRRADDVFGALDAEQQAAAHQVLLRLLWLGEGNRATPRRVQVSELVELALDPIVLSEVLRRFESERLLTFDRDPASGATTVEVAHESLLTEWPRVAGWIEQSRLDLLRHAVLSARVQEWLAAGRQTEDLLIGNRLAEVESWARGSTLRLTSDEAAFLGLAVERRRLEEAEHVAREQRRRGLERGARFRLGGFIGTAVLLVAVIAYAAIAWPGPAPHAVLVYPGMGDNGMYDSIKRGFDGAVARLGLDAQTVIEQPETLRDRLHRLADQGVRLIVVGYAWSNPDVELVARDHPETQFLASDYWGTLPNVWHPRMAFEEGAFLVGAAAALQTETGAVGIIVPADSNLDWAYPGGFEAGAHTVDRDIDVRTAYLTAPPRYGDVTYTDVNRAARDMYRGGADVVFFSGRTGALGLFEAAASESTAQGRQMWAVGVNTDWYVALPFVASLERMDAGPWREHVFTSLITRFDLGISALLEEHVAGSTTPAVRRFGLADGAFELASSGDFIAEHGPQLAALRAQIVAGQIVVPEYPADRGPPR
jgi:basic membrane lipoprotein Med (substrate-binding protein (PBP1-ABC) superfamily)